MKLYFKTKITRNGNNHIIDIDFDNKTYSRGYRCNIYCYRIEIKKCDLDCIIEELKENGYKEV